MRVYLSFLFFALIIFTASAQDRRPSNSKIEAAKIAFITSELSLTPDEAQKFWPVYNNFKKEIDALFAQKGKNYETNKDSESAVLTDINLDFKITGTKKRYYTVEFPKVISMQKIALLYRAESKFREVIIRQLGHGDGDKRDGDKKYDDKK